MTLKGKGYFLWQLPRCDDGDPGRIAARAQASGLSHVLIKILDGATWEYNVDKVRGIDLVPPVLSALRREGIEVWGWHYVRGDNPLAEASAAIRRIKDLGVDGYVIDAEQEYRDWNKAAAAGRFMEEIRRHLPDLPIALSSYRYPRSHPALPFDEFLEACDYAMPQVYFEQAHNPEVQLDRCLDQYMSLKHSRPLIPTAPTYARGDWRPTPDEIRRFLQHVKDLGMTAANAWSWDFAAREPYFDLFQAVADFEWEPKPPPQDVTERLVEALNDGEASAVADLYDPRAAHVTGERTVVGRDRIEAWYRTLFESVLPAAKYEVTGRIVDRNTRHMMWAADSAAGRVVDGNDTLGLREDQILYHYSYFSIQR